MSESGLRPAIFPIANLLGLVVMAFAATMLAPLVLALVQRDAGIPAFATGAGATFATGFLLWVISRRTRRELKVRDGVMLVALVWTSLPVFGALPLLSFYDGNLSFTDGYFEATSGITTSGATVLVGLDTLPQSINLWRHLMAWIGGMGIIVLAVAILPLLGVGGMQLVRAETPGPMKDSRLTPRIAQTAKALWLVYLGITVACVIALRLAGMSWFDAICHAFATVSLGGHSTHDQSIAYFNSLPIEAVLTLFQIVAALNFATHFLAWRTRGLAPYGTDTEARAVIGLLVTASLGAAIYLYVAGTYADFATALRHATFNLVTIAASCGFVSQDFSTWPIFVPMLMLFLSCVTASSGSTGSGIKMVRTQILVKQTQREMLKMIHPSAQLPLKLGGGVIRNEVVFAVLAFTFLYFCCVLVLTFLLLASGLDFISAFTAAVASLNNAGPGLGVVGPASNYAALTDFQTWVCAVGMILGRLEIFTLLVIFTPAFWRK
jgi:trk system potassium uptake protein TrkH